MITMLSTSARCGSGVLRAHRALPLPLAHSLSFFSTETASPISPNNDIKERESALKAAKPKGRKPSKTSKSPLTTTSLSSKLSSVRLLRFVLSFYSLFRRFIPTHCSFYFRRALLRGLQVACPQGSGPTSRINALTWSFFLSLLLRFCGLM